MGHLPGSPGFFTPLRRALAALAIASLAVAPAWAAQREIVGPAGSMKFGGRVAALPNGNIVVTDPKRIDTAAYLYRPDGTLVSTITGFLPGYSSDDMGAIRIVVLRNGNYVLISIGWTDGTGGAAMGAVTFGDKDTGVSGVVSAANSLVGSREFDRIGSDGIVPLDNGNYLVVSNQWGYSVDHAPGAVTWGDGRTGVSGVVSAANSIVGNPSGGVSTQIRTLANGNYVVQQSNWNAPDAPAAGAIRWCDAARACVGPFDATNSFVGTHPYDAQYQRFVPLANGNYVIALPSWDDGDRQNVGAVVWADGRKGLTGSLDRTHALIGGREGNYIGYPGITALANGNYVVRSSDWEDDAHVNQGAATWMDGTRPASGVVSAANSLVGPSDFDFVSADLPNTLDGPGVTALRNGNYVVSSPYWDNGKTEDVGAVTWANGWLQRGGTVTADNSLIGAAAGANVGLTGVVPLANGNYVVNSPGAVTWRNGTLASAAVVSAANSLVGVQFQEGVGELGSTQALTNGNYVSSTYEWDNVAGYNAGAIRLGDGTTGMVGAFTATNAIVGTQELDLLAGVRPLDDGNFVVASHTWANGAVDNAGLVAWMDGRVQFVGPLSAATALVGQHAGDSLGDGGILPAPDGRFIAVHPDWDNGAIGDAGAVTLAHGPVAGAVSAANSVVGTEVANGTTGMGYGLFHDYDPARRRLVVGLNGINRVALRTEDTDFLFRSGFEDDDYPCNSSHCRDAGSLYVWVAAKAPANDPDGPGRTKKQGLP